MAFDIMQCDDIFYFLELLRIFNKSNRKDDNKHTQNVIYAALFDISVHSEGNNSSNYVHYRHPTSFPDQTIKFSADKIFNQLKKYKVIPGEKLLEKLAKELYTTLFCEGQIPELFKTLESYQIVINDARILFDSGEWEYLIYCIILFVNYKNDNYFNNLKRKSIFSSIESSQSTNLNENKKNSSINNKESSAKIFANKLKRSPKNYVKRENVMEEFVKNIEESKVILMYGIGGIGKTSILTKYCECHTNQKIGYFDLTNAPSFASIAKLILRDAFSETILDDNEDFLIDLLSKHILHERITFIFDNLESIMLSGNESGRIKKDYEAYYTFFKLFVETEQKSTLVLSGREKLLFSIRDIENIKEIQLRGLSDAQSKELLSPFNLQGSDGDWEELVKWYQGNPLALKIIAVEISDMHDGLIERFLGNPEIPHELQDILSEQFDRLTLLEQVIMYWLAVEREPTAKIALTGKIIAIGATAQLITKSITNIKNRCLIELAEDKTYALQPVIMEFLTAKIVSSFVEEIISGNPRLINLISLIDTNSKEFILDTQKRLLVFPISDLLVHSIGEIGFIEKITNIMRETNSNKSYCIGNMLNILLSVTGIIENIDLSNKYILYVDLRDVKMNNVNFNNSYFEHVLFKYTFGNLIDVRFTYDDSYIIGGATDYSVNIWNAADMSYVSKIQLHTDWVRSVASNEKYIASASNDEKIIIYDYKSKVKVKLLNGHKSRVRKVKFLPSDDNILYSSGDDKNIKIWNINSDTVFDLMGHTDVVWDFDFIEKDNYIISGSDDKTVRLWDTETGDSELLFKSESSIKSLVFDREDTVYTGCDNGRILCYSLSRKEIFMELNEHQGTVWGLSFCAEKKILASCSADKHVILWNSFKPQKVINAHDSVVWAINFNNSGSHFVTTGDDYEFKLWDIDLCLPIDTIRGYTNLLRTLSLHNPTDRIAVGGDDAVIRMYNICNDEVNKVFPYMFFNKHKNRVRHIDWNRDGTSFISASDDGTVIRWNAANTEDFKRFVGHVKRVWTVSYIDNNTFASAGEENEILIWDIEHDTPIKRLKGHESWIWSLSYNRDKNLLSSASEDGTCIIWDLSTFEKKFPPLAQHKKWLFSCSFSEDGSLVVTGSADCNAHVYDTKTGSLLTVLSGHTGWVWCAIFVSNDIVATGSQDGTIRIWDINSQDKRCIKILDKHTSWVVSLGYSKKHARLFSASADSTVKIWSGVDYSYVGELHVDKPYDDIQIDNVHGLTKAEINSLIELGAKKPKYLTIYN